MDRSPPPTVRRVRQLTGHLAASRRAPGTLAPCEIGKGDVAARTQQHPIEVLQAARSRPGQGSLPPAETPFIDLDCGNPVRLADELRAAIQEDGFFYVRNHGVPQGLLQTMVTQTRQFHNLPLPAKMALEIDGSGCGYLPLGRRMLPTRETPNQNEAFLMKRELGPRNIVFPDCNVWPSVADVPDFQPTCAAYAAAMEALAMRLLPIFARALDLPETYFADVGAFTAPLWRLRCSRYPALPAAPGPGGGPAGFGIHPHVDTSFMTILHVSSPGLCYYKRGWGRWVSAPAPTDLPCDDGAPALLVNTGELLRRWSNDVVQPALHFADNRSGVEDRVSIPFFFNANADHVCECLPSCQSPDRPSKYAPQSYLQSEGVTQGE